MKLDEKGLEAAWTVYHGSTNDQRGALSDAIRAYLTSATPPDVAGLIERLDVRWEATDEPTARKINRFIRERKEAATALLLSAGGGVPDGWKLVPVEPTPEMLGAFWRQKNCGTQEVGERDQHTDDYSAYRAMLAASPTVETGHAAS